MKSIEVNDFRDNVIDYLTGDEVFTIERGGKPIGYYLPAEVTTEPERRKHAVEELGKTVRRILEKSGLTEDELVSPFDPNVPLDDLATLRRPVSAHAPRG